jgi:D-gamma-glutamyl-meso-diaminopimelic acid endopeptidase CwlS
MKYHAITTILCLVLGVLLVPGAGYAADATSTYVVRSGDTLSQISLRYGVTVQTLASVNTLSDPSRLTPGQVLKIPRGQLAHEVPQAQPAASRAAQPALLAVYWVRWGDTLFGIAARYGVTADVLKEANGLWTDIILPGQRLDIPARGSAAALGRRYMPMPQPIPVPPVAFLRTVRTGSVGERIVREAERYLGVRFVWGAASPRGMDCSGLVYLVFSRFEPSLGRVRSEDYYRTAKPVEPHAILPGDLVFFTTDNPGPSHVGIFVGEGKFIHASSTGSDVTISSLDDPNYGPGFLGVRRIVNPGN